MDLLRHTLTVGLLAGALSTTAVTGGTEAEPLPAGDQVSFGTGAGHREHHRLGVRRPVTHHSTGVTS